MPKQKAPKGTRATDLAEINDPRFSNFATDARFRLPSKKHTRTKIDKRFSALLKDEDVVGGAKVDRYGRKLEVGAKKKALKRLYVPEDSEGEDDEVVEKELDKAKAYDPARGGGFSSSEDESEDEEDGGVEIGEGEFPDLHAEQTGLEMGEVTSRIAVVNMDWDHIRAIDLMAVFQSFLPPGGKIQRISVYQSDFGTERLAREEAEGPDFGDQAEEEEKGGQDDEDDSEDSGDEDEKIRRQLQKEDEGQEVDSAKLRQYQLDRLRYFYAVMECSDNETAQHIYEATDGSEYLSSANFFDLRFVPDGTEFENVLRDSCTSIPDGYRPNEFITDALQHSKVKLTWDMDPEETTRKEAIKRAFTGSRADIAANDLAAYVGNDSSESEEEPETEVAPKKSKKELERERIRAALGLTDEVPAKKSSVPVGDLEITFTPGLAGNEKGGIFENEPIKEETTAERYIRKEKERKARRREKAKAARVGPDPDASGQEETNEPEKEDLGFDDPFFADEQTKDKASKTAHKEERRKKREAKRREAQAAASNKAELELLMEDNATAERNQNHFDINEIARAEKRDRKKGKKSKEKESKRGGLQEDFEINVNDPRFSAVYESHEFAIDRSHPRFQETKAMKRVLDEGRKRRNLEDGDETSDVVQKKHRAR